MRGEKRPRKYLRVECDCLPCTILHMNCKCATRLTWRAEMSVSHTWVRASNAGFPLATPGIDCQAQPVTVRNMALTVKARDQRWAAWIFGTLLVLYLMVVALLLPEPAPFQEQVLRLLMASLAGFFSYFFLGAIVLKGRVDSIGKTITATGGFALFSLVYFFPSVTVLRSWAGEVMPSAIRRDPALQQVQAALSQSGLLSARPTGVRNWASTNALRDFQQQKGLPATGLLSPETLRSIANLPQKEVPTQNPGPASPENMAALAISLAQPRPQDSSDRNPNYDIYFTNVPYRTGGAGELTRISGKYSAPVGRALPPQVLLYRKEERDWKASAYGPVLLTKTESGVAWSMNTVSAEDYMVFLAPPSYTASETLAEVPHAGRDILAIATTTAEGPLAGATGNFSGNGWQVTWLDLKKRTYLDQRHLLRIRLEGNAENVVVRLLPAESQPASADGVEGDVRKVPPNKILEIALSNVHPNVKQVSVHSGKRAFDIPLGANNGVAKLLSVEVLKR